MWEGEGVLAWGHERRFEAVGKKGRRLKGKELGMLRVNLWGARRIQGAFAG